MDLSWFISSRFELLVSNVQRSKQLYTSFVLHTNILGYKPSELKEGRFMRGIFSQVGCKDCAEDAQLDRKGDGTLSIIASWIWWQLFGRHRHVPELFALYLKSDWRVIFHDARNGAKTRDIFVKWRELPPAVPARPIKFERFFYFIHNPTRWLRRERIRSTHEITPLWNGI